MCLRFMFLLTTRLAAWLRLARREERWKTAEILILRHQLAVLRGGSRAARGWEAGLGGPGTPGDPARRDTGSPPSRAASAGYPGTRSCAGTAISSAAAGPPGALAALWDVLGGTAPVIEYHTVIEADLLAGLAYRELGDQRAANQAAERALALAEADRVVLRFAMTGSRELLAALSRHETAHAALLADILDVMHRASLMPEDLSVSPQAGQLSPGELRVLRYRGVDAPRATALVRVHPQRARCPPRGHQRPGRAQQHVGHRDGLPSEDPARSHR